jgi:hypothetical protein
MEILTDDTQRVIMRHAVLASFACVPGGGLVHARERGALETARLGERRFEHRIGWLSVVAATGAGGSIGQLKKGV